MYRKEGFYTLVSDKISVQRSLPDWRPEACKFKKYLRNLSDVSVIITFHNEVWSVLLRCIHSVFNRSPPELLHEIILINDNSTFEELYEPLKRYINDEFGGKVKAHDNPKREGLIRARMIGAKLASGDVIIFLDSHMEVANSWLPPLLDPIVLSPTYATVPIIEGLNHATFEYLTIGDGYKGIFDWNFRYQWLPFRPPRNDSSANFKLSCMTGGAYAIRREHFFHLGGYDEGLKIWNGENYELTQKLWLCSGGIMHVPCSRVIHLSKMFSAYRSDGGDPDFVGRNLKRIAEVWLDDYKKYFYKGNPEHYDKLDAGDLTRQFDLKKKLKCKPFKYYLEEVAPEMLVYYPIVPQYFATSSVQHISSQLCIGLNNSEYYIPLILVECADNLQEPNHNSDFTLTFEKSIQFNDSNTQCFNANNLELSNCHHLGSDQHWIFNFSTRQIYSPHEDKCLAGSDVDRSLYLAECNAKSSKQKWKWGYENVTALKDWSNTGIILS